MKNLKTIKEVAEMLKLSQTVIQKRIKQGKMKKVIHKGIIMIDIDRSEMVGAKPPGHPTNAEILKRK